MGIHIDKDIILRASYITRQEGLSSLLRRGSARWLQAIYSHLPIGFNGMEYILKHLRKYNYYETYSFDVFDTLLRRRIDPPELVKLLVAEYMSKSFSRGGSIISSEEILRQRNVVEEAMQKDSVSRGKDAVCFLDNIILETLQVLGVKRALDARKVVEYEIALEKIATEPMPEVFEVLSYLKSLGKRVICVSDSYLSPVQIASILEHHDLARYIDKLYVSCDLGKIKATGNLFRHVVDNEFGSVVHIGDHYLLDYAVPSRLGIKALWFHSRSEQRRKNKLRVLHHGKNKMNYVNAIVKSSNMYKNEVHRIGYEVFGPALTVFVHDVAEQALKDGVETLFFVARDGYVMKKLYETLQRGIYADFDLPSGRYLCLGRLPVRTASLVRFTAAEVSEIQRYMARQSKKTISLNDILKSYGLVSTRFVDVVKRYEIDPDEPMDEPGFSSKLNRLLEDNEFQDIIKIESDKARTLLWDYLVSIGFLGKRRVAVVDANAEGMTQAILDRTFSSEKSYPMVSRYYFNALDLKVKRADINLDVSQVKGIVSDWRRDSEIEQEPFLLIGMLIELFSHPNHGVVVGYKENNGRVIPVFKKTPQESLYPVTSQGLRGILDYGRDYSKYYNLHNQRCEELLEDLKINIKTWVACPPKGDVEPLKNLFVTSDWPQESNHSFITEIRLKDIITIGRFRKQIESSMWLQGTLTLAPVPGLNSVFRGMRIIKNRAAKKGHILSVFEVMRTLWALAFILGVLCLKV